MKQNTMKAMLLKQFNGNEDDRVRILTLSKAQLQCLENVVHKCNKLSALSFSYQFRLL